MRKNKERLIADQSPNLNSRKGRKKFLAFLFVEINPLEWQLRLQATARSKKMKAEFLIFFPN
jgi:hypothetical protein